MNDEANETWENLAGYSFLFRSIFNQGMSFGRKFANHWQIQKACQSSSCSRLRSIPLFCRWFIIIFRQGREQAMWRTSWRSV